MSMTHAQKVKEGIARARQRKLALAATSSVDIETQRLLDAGLNKAEIEELRSMRASANASPAEMERLRLRGMGGLSDEEIDALVALKFPEKKARPRKIFVDPSPTPEPEPKPERVMASETLGPDEALVKAYEERMKNYVPPPGPVTFEVVFPARWADYVKRKAHWFAAARGRPVSVEECVQLIVRAYWLTDDDRLAMSQGGSGPAGRFNPASGGWQ